jgi:hypothetical protein
MRIQVTGVQATKDMILEDYQTFIRELADDTLKAAQKFTPVRTGNARKNWEAKVSVPDNFRQSKSNDNFVVSNQVPYVEYLDKGTRKMKPANNGRGIIGPTLSEIKGRAK